MHSSHDPKGLIRESYRIEGISDAECRSILVDWALSLPNETDPRIALGELLAHYGNDASHPMTALLKEGVQQQVPARKGRRRRK